jgi:hypothetical protein
MVSLVGYTGFVGSNLANSYHFNGLYNSKNIQAAYHTNPDLLIYAGLRAEKFLANKDEKADFALIEQAIKNIKAICPKQMVLISTIDVYRTPVQVDEDTPIITDTLHPYGKNRYYLEQWVENNIKDYLIVRLPGLFGENIKKNFIFDIIRIIPSMLNESKYLELSKTSAIVQDSYVIQANGFYHCRDLSETEKSRLKQEFLSIGFSALNFTDSRGVFQFYNLSNLWGHIQSALKRNICLLNLATEPVRIDELYYYIFQRDFVNKVAQEVPCYDFRTKYSEPFNGRAGYIFDKGYTLKAIKQFVEAQR